MTILTILAAIVIVVAIGLLGLLFYSPFILSGRIAQWEEDNLGIRRS